MDTVALRKDYEQFFTMSTRTDGKEFVKLKDDVPDDLSELIRDIHFNLFDGCLPNDWIYATTYEAFEHLQHENMDNINIEADCYYRDLHNWFGEPFAHEYCNETMQDFVECKDIYQIIGYSQQRAMERIYSMVDEFINEERE